MSMSRYVRPGIRRAVLPKPSYEVVHISTRRRSCNTWAYQSGSAMLYDWGQLEGQRLCNFTNRSYGHWNDFLAAAAGGVRRGGFAGAQRFEILDPATISLRCLTVRICSDLPKESEVLDVLVSIPLPSHVCERVQRAPVRYCTLKKICRDRRHLHKHSGEKPTRVRWTRVPLPLIVQPHSVVVRGRGFEAVRTFWQT